MKFLKLLAGTTVALFLSSSQSLAQTKYGKVTMEELNMTTYPQDTVAEAVILSNVGDIRFVYSSDNGDFQYEYTVEKRIKILNEKGLEWCNDQIDYYVRNRENKEDIRKLEGTTYNLENGKIVKTKMSKDNIFQEEQDDNWKRTKFTLPGAKVGSVIEYKYTIVSDFYYEIRDFIFQYGIPSEYTAFEIVIPEYFIYNVNQQGYENIPGEKTPTNETFRITYRGGSENITCSAEKINYKGINIAALRREPYLWTLNDYRSKVGFELRQTQFPHSMTRSFSSSWEKVDERIWDSDLLGGNLKKEGLFKDDVAGTEQSIQGAIAIDQMLKSKVKWNEKNALYPSNLGKALKEGLGNSADMNFLLINALNAAKFNAFPILLSTRSNGRLPISNPSMTSFNYVVTGLQIDTVMYVIDASDKYGAWNVLPDKAMVPQGRMMVSKMGRWTDLSNTNKGAAIFSSMVTVEPDKIVTKNSKVYRGQESRTIKETFYTDYKSKEDYIEKLEAKIGNKIEDFEITGIDNGYQDVKIKYTETKDEDSNADLIYLTPIENVGLGENPFKNEIRKYPINYNFLTNRLFNVNIAIPEGYQVDELPQSVQFTLANKQVGFTYMIGQAANHINVKCQYQINDLLVAQTEYDSLKELYAQIAKKLSEQIVLKKITAE